MNGVALHMPAADRAGRRGCDFRPTGRIREEGPVTAQSIVPSERPCETSPNAIVTGVPPTFSMNFAINAVENADLETLQVRKALIAGLQNRICGPNGQTARSLALNCFCSRRIDLIDIGIDHLAADFIVGAEDRQGPDREWSAHRAIPGQAAAR